MVMKRGGNSGIVVESKEHDADVCVPRPLGEATLCMKILQHPKPVFYKDEGGKANHLVVVAGIQDLSNQVDKNDFSTSKTVVEPKLCYENGREVEDAAEIFKVLSLEPKILCSLDDKITVKFRIEKVSRRKDGQRFKVRFDVNPSSKALFEVASATTTPVVVLSKRKSPASVLGERSLNGLSNASNNNNKNKNIPGMGHFENGSSKRNQNRQRGQSMLVTKNEFNTFQQVAELRKTMLEMSQKIDSLVGKVGFLEEQNSYLREAFNKRCRNEFQANNPAIGDNELENCQQNKSIKREKLHHNVSQSFLKLDCNDAEILSCIVEDGEHRRSNLKRSASSDVTFNFGLPSSYDSLWCE